MPGRPAERPGRRPLVAALLVLLLLPALAACSAGDDAPAAAPDLTTVLGEVLSERSEAVLEGDRAAWLAPLSPWGRTYRARQETLYANLVQLPLAAYRTEVVPGTLVRERDGDVVLVTARTWLQVDGVDRAPSSTIARYRFVRVADAGGGATYRLASDDLGRRTYGDVAVQPWTLGPVQVRRAGTALVLLDAGADPGDAAALTRVVADAVGEVRSRVPYGWNGGALVYALSDERVLRSVPDLPGGDADDLDGLTFPVREDPDRSRGDNPVTGLRVLLHPRMLGVRGTPLVRLVRHELTHVAVGVHDDGIPVWLAEGVAEWVSSRSLPYADRAVPRATVRAAEAGPLALPDDDTFNGGDSETNYGLALTACEVLARGGEDVVWSVVDRLHDDAVASRDGRASADDVDAALRDLAGTDVGTLVEQARSRVLALYA